MATSSKSKKTTSSRRPTRTGQNSSSVEKMQVGLKRRLSSRAFLVISGIFLGVLLTILLIVLWFVKIYADPQHVFWVTLKNNLATQSITKNSVRASNGSSSHEFTQMAFSPQIRVRDLRVITDNSTRPASHLTLETIGTADNDYQRYSHIERPNTGKTQKDYQKVYQAWLKNGGQEGTSGQIVGNTLFGAVLFGDFNSAGRQKLYSELKSSYQVNFASVNKQGGLHRRTYVYRANVPLQKYARLAHDYALALNLPLASQINPKNYRPTDQLQISITIDVLSRQIKKIDYLRQNFSEEYSGQGNVANIQPPAKTVSIATFQNAIRAINQ